MPTPAPPAAFDPKAVTVAVRGVAKQATVGIVVFDRTTGTELLSVLADRQFRSASLVKLLIAIDVLADGADAATRKRVAMMLRLSDDGTASAFWMTQGGSALVTRTARVIGLRGTRPPTNPRQWGDVLLTARDVLRIYEYVLRLPTADRELVVDALASAPRQAADGFDQHFGIPDGISVEWAIKQGWSNSARDIVVHSTGLVGPGWRYVVVLLTEHPLSTRFAVATRAVTAGARVLSPLLAP
ncbi:hypothetical protein Acsp05_46690 [Actinokineospora sp. NBRC 105648]|nr:hypothetical protein Acsp05_46690 [Actinokineospora sp. NBRC 105648]